MITGQLRGHLIYWDGFRWRYVDTNQSTAENPRDCGRCGCASTIEGHDACLGTLPGVMNACCGHGETNEAYIQFEDHVLRGEEALEEMRRLTSRRGSYARCTVCGRNKNPRGRSAPLEMAASLCDRDCEGYDLPPLPGDLWPGETAEEFGYPCQTTEERKDGDA